MNEEKNKTHEHENEGEDRSFKGIPRERMLELARQVAEIQKYQKEHGLEDKGDPPDDED
ncbi:MAG: hypothetical protein ACPL7K_03505 [Armatimonadota bacterium]|jgi:hypothetical protein|uniref:hypothetical protein n=1 Tax=Thermogutta sp. TaxID=1962930 RepID=UPI00321FB4D0